MAQSNPFDQFDGPARAPVFGTPNPYKMPLERAELDSRTAALAKTKLETEALRQKMAQDAPDGAGILPRDQMVKALIDGRMAFPSGAALRAPYWQNLLSEVARQDPTFDAINYNARAKTRADFTSGKSAQNIKALNTAIGHLGQLNDQISGTASHNFTPLNALINGGMDVTGDPGPGLYNQTAGAVASELTQVFRGSGGAEADVKRYLGELSPNASAAQKAAAVRNIAGLLRSRLNEIGNQYQQGMGKSTDPLTLLNPHAQQVFTKLAPPEDDGSRPNVPSMTSSGGGPPFGGNGSAGGGAPGGGGTSGQGVATQPYEDQYNAEISRMTDRLIRQGKSAADINAAIGGGVGRTVNQADVTAAQNYLKTNPSYKGLLGEAVDKVPTTFLQRASASAPAALASGALDGVTAGFSDEALAGAKSLFGGGTYAQEHDAIDARNKALAQIHPTANTIGELGGGLLGSAGVEAGAGLGIARALGTTVVPEALAARGLWAARGGDAIYGGLSGAGSADDGNRLGGALGGAALGLGGGMFGRGVTRAVGGALTGVTNEAVRTLRDRGVPLTVGQTVGQSGIIGRAVKGVEDRLTGFPLVGDVINARRNEGFSGFNNAAFNEALAPIGATTGNIAQEQGVDLAQDAVGQGYNRALNGVRVQADAPFVQQMAPIVQRAQTLPDPMAARAGYTLNTRVGNSFGPNGELTGNGFQQSIRGLQQDASAVASEPYGHDFGQVAGDAQDALRGLLDRQSSATLPAFDDANQAFRNTEVLRSAVNTARNGGRTGETGLFAPSQLSDAAAANARRFGNTQGTTNQPFFDLSRAGQAVLPSKVADSGTAGRLAVTGGLAALGGGGAGLGALGGDAQSGGEAGLGVGGLLALGGTRTGQRVLAHLLADRPDLLVQAGQQVNRAAPIGGMFGASVGTQFLPSR